jgi:hypothetical protein
LRTRGVRAGGSEQRAIPAAALDRTLAPSRRRAMV